MVETKVSVEATDKTTLLRKEVSEKQEEKDL